MNEIAKQLRERAGTCIVVIDPNQNRQRDGILDAAADEIERLAAYAEGLEKALKAARLFVVNVGGLFSGQTSKPIYQAEQIEWCRTSLKALENIDAALEPHEESAQRCWRHKKRGTVYVEVGLAQLQTEGPLQDGAAMIVYRGEDDRLWVRASSEFKDGRFERVESHAESGEPK